MAIHIKSSKIGSLHKLLGKPVADKLTAGDIADKPGDSMAMKKKKNFARNAKKWNGGGSLSKLIGK